MTETTADTIDTMPSETAFPPSAGTNIGPQKLLAAAAAGGDYLSNMTGADGRYIYSYLANSDTEPGGYNILRHAGTTFSLLELYAVTGEERHLAAADRALVSLVASTGPCPGPSGLALLGADPADVPAAPRCVHEDREIKLGGNALAIVAMTEHVTATGSRRHVAVARQLAHWITGVQGADGAFQVHKLDALTGLADPFVSGYYPGEAVLALVRLYEVDGNPEWLDSAEDAALYLVIERDGAKPSTELAHDHWLLYGLERLARHRPRALWAEHAARLSDAIVAAQTTSAHAPARAEWIGGWGSPPRTAPAATRLEGLAAAWRLATATDDAERADALLEPMANAASFLLRTQIDEHDAARMPAPERAAGGVRSDLESDEIRIDTVQHFISAVLALAEIQRLTEQP